MTRSFPACSRKKKASHFTQSLVIINWVSYTLAAKTWPTSAYVSHGHTHNTMYSHRRRTKRYQLPHDQFQSLRPAYTTFGYVTVCSSFDRLPVQASFVQRSHGLVSMASPRLAPRLSVPPLCLCIRSSCCCCCVLHFIILLVCAPSLDKEMNR